MREEDVVIVGAGPAGVAAAVQCRRLGLNPLLIDKDGRAGGLVRNAYSVENYPGLPPVSGPAFAELLERHLERFGLGVVHCRLNAVSKEGGGYCLETDSGSISTSGVILATGTRAKKLSILGADELAGTRLFYEVHSARRLGSLLNTVVVGAGEAAFDYALTLAKPGTRVRMLARSAKPRARGRLVHLVEQNPFIELSFNTEPVQLKIGKVGISITVNSPAGVAKIETEAVFAAVGRESDARNFLNGLDAAPLGALSTRPGKLLVVGDARTGTLGQVGTAVGDGLFAAMSIARQLADDRDSGR